jgi:hypothetical protein
MTQPKFVPTLPQDQVRDAYQLEQPRPWLADRPADFRQSARRSGPGFGTQGPDQGYALRLARRFEGKLELAEGESFDDVSAAGVAVALRRAALFGRAPVSADLELAFSLFGCHPGAPADLVEWRTAHSRGLSHHPAEAHQLAGPVPESTLRLRPDDVGGRLSSWRALVGVG